LGVSASKYFLHSKDAAHSKQISHDHFGTPAGLSLAKRFDPPLGVKVVAAFSEADTAIRFEAIATAQVAMPFERTLPWLTKAKTIWRLT
jgi:hypothetical protein